MVTAPAFDAGRYPTAYAIDFVLAHGPAFRRLTGFELPATAAHESARRQGALDVLDDFAHDGGFDLTETLTALADQHLASRGIVRA